MALTHAKPLDVIALLQGADVSTSLLKTAQLQLMRLVLPAGSSLPEHHVAGELTLQCLQGRCEVATPTCTRALAAGDLLVLPAGEPHSVQAAADTVLLLTVVSAAGA